MPHFVRPGVPGPGGGSSGSGGGGGSSSSDDSSERAERGHLVRVERLPDGGTRRIFSKGGIEETSPGGGTTFKSKEVIDAEKSGQEPEQRTVRERQREVAERQLGTITRITTDPDTGDVTFHGVGNRRATFPSGGTTFTGADRPGGLRSEEAPLPAESRRPIAERTARETAQEVFTSLSQRIEARSQQQALMRERPAEQAARIARLEQPGFAETKFGALALEKKQELIERSGDEAFTAKFPQTIVGVEGGFARVGTQVSEFKSGRIPIQTTTTPDFTKSTKSRQFAEFERRIERTEKITEARKRFLGTINFEKGISNIEGVGSFIGGKISKGIVPLRPVAKPAGEFIGGAFTSVAGAPFFLIGAASFVPEIVGKTFITTEAISFRKQLPKGAIKSTLLAPAPEVGKTFKELATPKGAGFIMGAGLTAATSKFIKPPRVLDVVAERLTPRRPGKVEADIITDIYKAPEAEITQTKVVGKQANVKVIKTKPALEFTTEGRVTPETYATILSKKGQIEIFRPNIINLGEGEIALGVASVGKSQSDIAVGLVKGIRQEKIRTGKPGRPRTVNKAILTTPGERRVTFAHELIHHRTVPTIKRFIPPRLEERLPYRLQPSEVVAFSLEKRVAKRGFKVGESDIKVLEEPILFRKEGPLTFEFPRQKILQKSVAKSTPTVAVSRGKITRGRQTFDFTSVQVGRRLSGSLIGKKRDIIFKKTPKGKLELRVLAKERLDNRFIRRFKAELEAKVPSANVDTTPSPLISRRTVEFTPERIAIQKKKTLFGRVEDRLGFDVGKKVDGAGSFGKRLTKRRGEFVGVGKQKEFIRGRDIEKRFLGKATTKLTQIDVATPQTEITTVGGSTSIIFRDPDIKFALQPTFKPDVKTFRTDPQAAGPVAITEFIKRPTLTTERRTGFVSSTRYQFKQSRLKPFKVVGKAIKRLDLLSGLGKKAQVSIGRRRVKILAEEPRPRIFEPRTEPPLSAADIGRAIEVGGKPTVRVRPISRSVPTSRSREEVKSISQPKSEIRVNQEVFIRPKIEIRPDVRIRPRIRPSIRQRTEATTRVTTRQRTITKTIARTPPIAGGAPGSFVNISTVPPPPIIIKPKPDTRARKKKKKRDPLQLLGRFQPSVRAAGEEIFGKRPTVLTGLEVRPIIR